MIIRVAMGFVLGVASVVGLAGLLLYGAPFSHTQAVALYGGAPGQYLDFPDGTQAHYRDQGNPDGPPVVLLHGSGSSLHTWEAWVDVLGDRYRMISLDLPGHGLTGRTVRAEYNRLGMTNFVLRFAHELDLGEFVLVGHSMGGSVAWNLARYRPYRVSHLVLLAPSGIGRVPREPPLAFRLAGNPITRPLLNWIAPRWLIKSALNDSFYDDSFVTAARTDRYWNLNRLAGNRAVTMTRFGQRPWIDLADLDTGIEVPTLIMWGADDEIVPYDRYRVEWDLRSKFEGGPAENPVEVFAATGHMLHVERAQESAAVFDRFIQDHPADIPLAADRGNP